MDDSHVGKVLSILMFTIICLLSIIILVTPPATTYEISIYSVYPFYFWFLVIVSLFSGITILIRSYLNENERNNWIFGFVGILITNFILLSLPLIRNYFIFGRGDILSHIGYMKNILITGYIGSDMYPILHILGVDTFLISNINLNRVTMIFPVLFSLFYIISFYLLFKQFFEDKDVILGMVISSILLFSFFQTVFMPNAEALLLIPFFLYCYFSSRKSNNKFAFAIITVILASFMTFLHPLISVTLILMLLIIEVSNSIYSKFYSKFKSKIRNPYTLITIITIIFFMWQSYAYLLVQSLKNVFNWLIGESGETQLQTYSSVISYGKPNLTDLLITIFNTYGQWIIITLISLIVILYLIRNRNKLNFVNIFSSLGFLFFVFWSALTISFVYIFGFGRTYALAVIMATFLVFAFMKLVLSNKNRTINKKGVKAAILCLILLPLLFFSTFNLYNSPLVKTPNEQVTASEYYGMQTFFENRNANFYTYEFGLSQKRFNDAIYGTYDKNQSIEKQLHVNRKNVRYTNTTPIDHFGYGNYTSIADYYNKTSYLLINDLGKETYPEIYPQYVDKWRFTPNDFSKLNVDQGASLICDNGNLEIYLIRS